jgi:hypothetical protein
VAVFIHTHAQTWKYLGSSTFPSAENKKDLSYRHLLLAEVGSGTAVPRKSQNVGSVAEEANA